MTRVSSNPARRGSFWAFMLIGAAIFIGGFTALYYRQQQPGGDPNGMLSRQDAGQSMAGKNDTAPASPTDPGRAQAIEKSEKPQVAALTPEQKQRLADVLKNDAQAHRDSVPFSISIGALVPPQIELSKLPDAAADILHGYNGDKYVVVGDQLVIVDSQARRIVALIPNVS
jgi:hypothetical protein